MAAPTSRSSVSLARIQAVAHGDSDFVREMVGEFATDARAAMRGFEQAFARSDAGEMRKCAHSLKGLAATVDAGSLYSLADQAERYALAGDVASLAGLTATLAGEVNATIQGLEDLLGETTR